MFGDQDACAYEKDCDWVDAAQAVTAFGLPTTAQNLQDVDWMTNVLAHFGFGLVVRPVTFGEYTKACQNDKRLANADVMTFLLKLGKGYTYELAPDPRPPALVGRNRLFAETARQSAAIALYNLARSGALDGLPDCKTGDAPMENQFQPGQPIPAQTPASRAAQAVHDRLTMLFGLAHAIKAAHPDEDVYVVTTCLSYVCPVNLDGHEILYRPVPSQPYASVGSIFGADDYNYSIRVADTALPRNIQEAEVTLVYKS